jgi:hypothetical protein
MLQKKSMVMVAMLTAIALTGCVSPQSRTPTVNKESALNEAQKQREMVVEDYISSNKKLQAVASKVIVSGAEMCGEKVKPYFGFSTWNDDAFKDDWKRAAQSKYNLTGQLHVSYVAPGSVADIAGLKEGDIIQAANGALTPYGKNASTLFDTKLKELGKPGTPVEFTVRRGPTESKISIAPTKACDFNVRLSPDDVKNAYADGQNIVFFKGMMDFFRTDEEIALVFSHELAHNSMKHIDAKKKNATIGTLLGLVLDIAAAAGGVNTNGDFSRIGGNAGGSAYSVEFEQEADYVGLYFMAQAGYKIDDAPNFWRRMATSNSAAITIKSSHPTTPERFLALESTVNEIKDKVAKGEPLKHEMKPQQVAKEASAPRSVMGQ